MGTCRKPILDFWARKDAKRVGAISARNSGLAVYLSFVFCIEAARPSALSRERDQGSRALAAHLHWKTPQKEAASTSIYNSYEGSFLRILIFLNSHFSEIRFLTRRGHLEQRDLVGDSSLFRVEGVGFRV